MFNNKGALKKVPLKHLFMGGSCLAGSMAVIYLYHLLLGRLLGPSILQDAGIIGDIVIGLSFVGYIFSSPHV